MGIIASQGQADSTPSVLGQQAIAQTQQSGDLAVVGSALSGLSNTAAYLYQSRVASNNAKIQERNAQAALRSGEYSAEVKKLQTGETVAAQKAGYAAGNVDVGGKTPQAVMGATENIGEMDALTIRYNAAREAYSLRTEAAAEKAKAGLARFGALGALDKGAADTYASYLSASQALLSKKREFYQYGVT